MDELIKRLKERDKDAFVEVMRMYKKPILNFLTLLVGNTAVAEELAQDTFVRVFLKAHTLKSNDLKACKAWIYKIASNLAMSEFRKRKIKNLVSFSHWNEERGNALVYHPTCEVEMMVEQMLAHIPEKYRIPLIMKEMENMAFEEIALALNKPVGTVKSLVFRGKRQLRNLWQTEKGEEYV